MDEKNRNTINSTIRQSIIQKLDFHVNALEYAIVKLYMNYQNSKVWENTNLEGYLVLVNDSYCQSLKLQIFDFINFNKEFEIELYANIKDGYEIIKDTFHSVEFPSFFLGLNFSDKSDAEKVKSKIFLFSKLKNINKYYATYVFEQDRENSSQEINVNTNSPNSNNNPSTSTSNNKILATNVNVITTPNHTMNNINNNNLEFISKYKKLINEINGSEIK